MVDDGSLPIVLFELHDNLTLASGLAVVTIVADPSSGEVVDAENFIFGDVSGDAAYDRDEAEPGTECIRGEARTGNAPIRAAPPPGTVPARSGAASVTPRRSGTASNTPRKTARAASVPQANHARGCVGLGERTDSIRLPGRVRSAPAPAGAGLRPGGYRRKRLRRFGNDAAPPRPRTGGRPRPPQRVRHGPDTERLGAQRRRSVDRDGPTGRAAPDSERHGPAAKPPGREAPPARTRGEAEGPGRPGRPERKT